MNNSPYNIFGTDKNLESGAGVWLEYPGFSIKIHRAGGSNTKYEAVGAEKVKPYIKSINAGIKDPDRDKRIMIETYAEAVIVDWKNVRNKDGDLLEFNRENVVMILTDLPDLFLDIQEQARNMAVFKIECEEIERKNL